MADTPAALHDRQIATRTGDRLPLRIYVPDPALEPDVLQAIDLWNHAAGVDWLELTHDERDADRVIAHHSLKGGDKKTAYGEIGGRHIWIPRDAAQTYWNTTLPVVIAHEIGHTFGLDHTTQAKSAYLPWATEQLMTSLPVPSTGAGPLPREVTEASQRLGQTPMTDEMAQAEDRSRGMAVSGMTSGPLGITNAPAPFAWYNERIAERFEHKDDPAQSLASELIFAGLISQWRVDLPGGYGWRDEAAHYTYHHYVQDVNQLATALKSSSARAGKLASVDKGQVPASSGKTTSRAAPRPSAPARPSSKPKTPTPAEQHGRQLA